MSLLQQRKAYKPFEYPWAYQCWERQQQIHWMPSEVSMGDDVQDWANNLTAAEKNLLTQIFRFFTQADIEVHDCYMRLYGGVFKPPEISMMLSAFANMETVHIAAYSYLLDTVGMPPSEYEAFIQYKEMKDKCDFLHTCNTGNNRELARTLAIYGGFTEGLQLFASFAILLNFPRFNKMKGMGQIVTWSVRDESLHSDSIIMLFNTFVREYGLWDAEMRDSLYEACRVMVFHEDKFIELAFEMGGVEGLTPEQVKRYIRYVANYRMHQFGLQPMYAELVGKPNPLAWMQEFLGAMEYANFFENSPTEYSRAATKGTWKDVFD